MIRKGGKKKERKEERKKRRKGEREKVEKRRSGKVERGKGGKEERRKDAKRKEGQTMAQLSPACNDNLCEDNFSFNFNLGLNYYFS